MARTQRAVVGSWRGSGVEVGRRGSRGDVQVEGEEEGKRKRTQGRGSCWINAREKRSNCGEAQSVGGSIRPIGA